MKKQITTFIILTALINFTTHAMKYDIDFKKSYGEFKIDKSPRLRKKLTQKEIMHSIINDKSHEADLVRYIIISSIIQQLELRSIITR